MTAGGRCGLLVGQAMGWLDESKMDHKMVIFPKGTWKNGMQTNMFGNFGWTLPKNRASFGVIATGFGIWAFSSEAILVTYCNLRNHEQGWLVLMSFESSYNHFWLNVNLVCIGLVVDSEGLILDIFQDPVKTLYPESWTNGTWKLWFSRGWFSGSMKFNFRGWKPSPTNNLADSSPIHLRKQSRHGTYGSQYWWNQGDQPMVAMGFPPSKTVWLSIGGHRRLCTSLESAESMASTGGPSVWSHEAKCHRVEMYSNMYIFIK